MDLVNETPPPPPSKKKCIIIVPKFLLGITAVLREIDNGYGKLWDKQGALWSM